jgi:YHS domain-containing protein
MKIRTLLFVSTVALTAILVLNGCEKKEPAAMQDHSEHTAMTEDMPMEGAVAAVDETIEQKTCPVMGNPINKDVFVEYNGKKVYFCCPSCKEDFEKDPEKYISKLPQFKE